MRRGTLLAICGVAASLWLGYLAASSPSTAALAQPDTPPPILRQILDANPGPPEAGNTNGGANIVEFFDYRCPYCAAMQPRLAQVVAEDKRVRLIFKDWPVFGGVSAYAAKVAIASNWQGKYLPVHDALFALGRSMTETSVRQAAESAGVDLKRMDTDLAGRSGEITAILSQTDAEARGLGFEGTPGFIIGNAVVPGALSASDILALLR